MIESNSPVSKRIRSAIFGSLVLMLAIPSGYGQVRDTGLDALRSIQSSFRRVADQVLPVVVEINVVAVVRQNVPQNRTPWDQFFGPFGDSEPREFRQEGLGSGVIVSKEGSTAYVVTNNHVVGTADEIGVTLYDGRQFEASVVGADPGTDLALIKFETRERVPVAELGDSDRLEVIGINSWIASGSGGSQGLGFAIPINTTKRAIEDFRLHGRVVYGWLGVGLGRPDYVQFPGIAEDLSIEDQPGALVLNQYTGSPADEAGLLPGDLIISVDGDPITDIAALRFAIGTLPPGRTIMMRVIRYGARENVTVTLGMRGNDADLAGSSNLWPGIMVIKISDEIRDQLELPRRVQGVVVASVAAGSSADLADVRQGDVITRIGNATVRSVMDFYRELNERDRSEPTLRITRGSDNITRALAR